MVQTNGCTSDGTLNKIITLKISILQTYLFESDDLE